jgi:hypothetical protein
MRKFTSIPEPTKSIDNLYATVSAMKQVIEELTGQRGDVGASRTYITDRAPDRASKGDLWITASVTYFWNGREWQALP